MWQERKLRSIKCGYLKIITAIRERDCQFALIQLRLEYDFSARKCTMSYWIMSRKSINVQSAVLNKATKFCNINSRRYGQVCVSAWKKSRIYNFVKIRCPFSFVRRNDKSPKNWTEFSFPLFHPKKTDVRSVHISQDSAETGIRRS